MQNETTTIDTPDKVGEIKSAVMLQLIGAATAAQIGQGKVMSVRSLYSNFRKYVDLDVSYIEFLNCLDSFRDEVEVRDGELGADVNYIGIKSGC